MQSDILVAFLLSCPLGRLSLPLYCSWVSSLLCKGSPAQSCCRVLRCLCVTLLSAAASLPCVQILPGWTRPFVQAREELSQCSVWVALGWVFPCHYGHEVPYFPGDSWAEPLSKLRIVGDRRVYSCTWFKIGLHLKVYFAPLQNESVNAQCPVPYGCLPVWDVWWSHRNFVSLVIGVHCQTGAACMALFVFLFVFAVNSCLILFQSMFLAMWAFFPTKNTLKVLIFTMFMERC